MWEYNLLKYVILIISICSIEETSSINLNDIDVPPVVILKNDYDDLVVLDCHYSIDESEKSLVVKWLKDDEVVYQWIRGNLPTVMPKFKDLVDETFVISTNHKDKFRALALKNISVETSGEYKCAVQTSYATKSMEKPLQVIDLSKLFLKINLVRKSNETHLECTVENVYPEPTIIFETDDDDKIILHDSYLYEGENGYFNRTSIATVEDDDDELDIFRCVLNFGDYSTNISAVATSASMSPHFNIPTFFVLFKIFASFITIINFN